MGPGRTATFAKEACRCLGERGRCPSFGALLPGLRALPILVLASVALSAAPALASPTWGIEVTHANAYGALGGVDPYTGSGATFARESGFNSYTVRVKNEAPVSDSELLTCQPGTWEGEPTFAYQWLRDGGDIPGAASSTYTTAPADEGTVIQCEVLGANAGGVAASASTNVQVPPEPETTPPAHVAEEGNPFVEVEGGKEAEPGNALLCRPNPAVWTGGPTFSYGWLRNGVAIEGATTSTYTLGEADEGTAIQCEVTATNAGGSAVAMTRARVVLPEGATSAPAAEVPPTAAVTSGDSTAGAVTVADRLPDGMAFAAEDSPVASGAGWECSFATGGRGATCKRAPDQASLAPGAEYPPLTLRVRVSGEPPLGSPPSGGVTNTVAVSGGGATTAATSDTTTIVPAVRFGIQSFMTSVTESLGNPFTQAGGHPFEASATFDFSHTVDSRGYAMTAGGSPKDVETELPPGFIGDPQNTTECTAAQAQEQHNGAGSPRPLECPADSAVGFVNVRLSSSTPVSVAEDEADLFPGAAYNTDLVYSLAPSPGYPAAFAFAFNSALFVINAKPRSDGDYGITVGDSEGGRISSHGLEALSLTLCSYGVTGHANEGVYLSTPSTAACAPSTSGAKPFLTNPTRCTGPALVTTLRANTYTQPAAYVSKAVYTGTSLSTGPSANESFLAGCNLLHFAPEVEFTPAAVSEGGTTQADEPTAATFDLKVPQTNEAGTTATPELKNATVTLPEGMTVDPSAADGLQTCSDAQFGLGSTIEPAEPAACPSAAQIGTVKVVTPLLEKPLEGQVFLGEPECSPCSNTDAESGRIFTLFVQVRLAERGVIVKLAGHVSANPMTGRLQATFTDQPQLPFSELSLTFNGGARAALADPQTCGTFTTTTDLTPWSTSGVGGVSGLEAIAGTPDATPSSSFNVDWNGAGGTCPGSLPFGPSFSAGGQTPTAGASGSFSVTIGREDRQQDISGVTLTTPPGLLGEVSQVPRCPETQANEGTCSAESQIGSTAVGAGPGPHPFYLSGKVYLTGPYKGAPFGLSIVVPAVAGPFNLGTVVVRASIAVNPTTSGLTIASDPLPQFVDGVQLRLRRINVEVNRPGFMLNPTSCAQQQVSATITAAQGANTTVSSPFEVGGCQSLPFAPSFTASTEGGTSKGTGASLTVKVAQKQGEASIAKVDVQLPRILPSRQSTLKQACTQTQFAANPAGCPADSDVGAARAVTPILNDPLVGPAYLVSHGGAAFPDLEIVLQGEGISLILDGGTEIHNGVTFSRFDTVPDAPITTFDLELPEGPHSILAAPSATRGSLCGQKIVMPTTITGQNGKQVIQKTEIAVTGCAAQNLKSTTKPLSRAQKLSKALRTCRKLRTKRKRLACDRTARKQYGATHKAKNSKIATTDRRGN